MQTSIVMLLLFSVNWLLKVKFFLLQIEDQVYFIFFFIKEKYPWDQSDIK